MTLDQLVFYYILFSLSGSIVVMFSIFLPAVQIIRAYDPYHPILTYPGMIMSGTAFMAFSAVTGPLQLLTLYYKDTFIRSFVEGLLGK